MTEAISHISRITLDCIEEACPAERPGETVAQIHGIVGCFSRTTVRHGLRQLVAEGRVKWETLPGAVRKRGYWRDAP